MTQTNTQPVRILHVLQRMEAAGVQTLLMNLYRNIDRSVLQFDFLVHYKEDQNYDEEIRSLGGRLFKLSVREDYNLPRYRKELRSFFSEHSEYMVLHGHMETLSGIWMKEAMRANIPTRIAHSHTAGFGSGLNPKKCIREIFRYQYPRYATDLFACSKAAGDFMFPHHSYTLIPNAIDTNRFRFSPDARSDVRHEFGISENTFVVGTIGRFHFQKNQAFLLDVFKELLTLQPDSLLILVGDGDERPALERKAQDLGISRRVLFTGKRPDANRMYQAFDVFVLPSFFEGLPLVGVEAQSAGCPSFFSSTVSHEVGITDLATFIPLDAGANAWAKQLAQTKSLPNRSDYAAAVSDAGYDIHALAGRLTEFYLERFEAANSAKKAR